MAGALVTVVEGLCQFVKDEVGQFVKDEVGQFVKAEVGQFVGVKKELEKLSSTFMAIQAVLEDAERQQVTKKGVRDWLGKLKDVAYEMEDILDEWKMEAHRSHGDKDDTRKRKRSWVPNLPLLSEQTTFRQDIAHGIREIAERLDQISKEKEAFKFNEVSKREVDDMPNMKERETSSLIDKSEIFGRNDVKDEIVNELVSEATREKRSFSVVSIVGMGGLGKTTLAQLVYNDERIKKHFDKKRIWACVSEDYDVKKILRKVLQSMNGSTDGDLDLDTLHQRIYALASENRFLLVLDDVWDGKVWEKLKVVFKDAARGSRILVTTRSHEVADIMATTRRHDLGILSDSDCWRLFTSRAFRGRNEEEWPPELTEVGKQIVQRCKGVPLAIRTVGSLLYRKRTEVGWQRVLESETWEWKSPDGVDILPALLLSYYNLPIHLKQCLSFCSLFPKDYELEKDELVQLWMAHGFIKSEGEEIEENGETYFDELLTRSLLQDAEKDEEGNTVRCKMHDLVHDLARFVTSGDYCIKEIGNPGLRSVNSHHLSLLVDDDVSSIPSPLCSAEHLRTLLLFGSSTKSIKEVPHSLLDHLKFLRALDLSSTEIENLPISIGKLKHLRYLDLSGLNITELPESVTDLYNLQTLKLHYCRRLCLLPSGIGKMVKLRYLRLSGLNITELPESVSELCNLQTLKIDYCKSLCLLPSGMSKMVNLRHLDLSDTKIENLPSMSKMVNLRHLDLSDTEIENLPSCLGKLKHLRYLDLSRSNITELPESVSDLCNLQTLKLNYCERLCLLPSGMSKMVNLRYLDLSGTKIENLPSSLGKLKHLRYLDLSVLNITELPESVSDLCNLQTLKLVFCERLCRLPSGISKMVKLQHLKIGGTEDLAFLPSGLGMLSSLRTLSKFPVGDEKNGGCNIRELRNLNHLRRYLKIKNLEKLIINPDEAREAELDQKCHLQELVLECNKKTEEEWGMLGEVEMEKMERVFEGLRPPHSNLKLLSIYNYAGSKFPSWLEDAEFSSLGTVELRNCKKCRSLPGLGKLPSLEELTLYDADEIEVVGGDFYGNGNEGGGKGRAFPELKKLHFLSMPNWEEWKLTKEDEEVMPSLDELYVYDCNKLKALPNCLPNTLRRVQITDCSEVIWAPDNPLPLLEDLVLEGDVRGILGKPLPCLPALKKIAISQTSIESLPSDGWGLLESLNTLEIYSCPGLASLPNGLGQIPALQTICVDGCSELRSLFDGFERLKSLHRLKIIDCPNLRPLPNSLQHLTALEELSISKCPLVTERLGKEKGEDWCNISHIPCIEIDGERIQ